MNISRIIVGLGAIAICWTLPTAALALDEANVAVSAPFGGAGDAVNGVRIQADGTIVIGGNLSDGPLDKQATGSGKGVVIRLSTAGKVLSVNRVSEAVHDIAIDAAGNIYVAAGNDGAIKLDPMGTKLLWKKPTEGVCARIDASGDGHCAALRYGKDTDSTPGAGKVYVFDPKGTELGNFSGRHNTLDVAIDGASKTVITIGWRQANAFDGKKKFPVQISHLTGRAYDGTEKYHLYDWSNDTKADNFLNKPSNNMADTRGYRCSMGADGKLYAAFEAAGGNHIFRYEPVLIDGKWTAAKEKKAKGDNHHNFANSRAEHKTVMAQFQPGTGAFLLSQEFCGRLSSGKANAVRVKNGAIAAGANGAVYLAGIAASGLPMTYAPAGTGDYNGGGFVLGMEPGLAKREFCLRVQPGANVEALDVRKVGDKTIVACGGRTSEKDDGFFVKNGLQDKAPPGSAFVFVLSD